MNLFRHLTIKKSLLYNVENEYIMSKIIKIDLEEQQTLVSL